MSVVIETTLGDITVDLYLSERPRACLNFLKLCKIKYYNYNLFHTISRGFIAQTGDPTGSRSGGDSIYGVLDGQSRRYFEGENKPRIKHTKMGLISFVGDKDRMIGSQFFLTLGDDLTYLDEKHCVFGEVVEGFDVLEVINEVICDSDDRPYQDFRVTHTVIIDDPYPDPERLEPPSRSPSPTAERLKGGRIAPDEDIDESEGKTAIEIAEMQAEREAKARATILEMVGDLPDAEMAPPENVLFVCKLNPVTTDDDLEIIFSRFGKINSCEVIRDKKSGDSLQYAFVEFDEKKACEDAYFKMDNVLIDDRRIHVDFSQSVSKIKWNGKGRGVTHFDEKGRKKNADQQSFKGFRSFDEGDNHRKDLNKSGSRKNDSQSARRDLKSERGGSGSKRSRSRSISQSRDNRRQRRSRERSRSPKRNQRRVDDYRRNDSYRARNDSNRVRNDSNRQRREYDRYSRDYRSNRERSSRSRRFSSKDRQVQNKREELNQFEDQEKSKVVKQRKMQSSDDSSDSDEKEKISKKKKKGKSDDSESDANKNSDEDRKKSKKNKRKNYETDSEEEMKSIKSKKKRSKKCKKDNNRDGDSRSNRMKKSKKKKKYSSSSDSDSSDSD